MTGHHLVCNCSIFEYMLDSLINDLRIGVLPFLQVDMLLRGVGDR